MPLAFGFPVFTCQGTRSLKCCSQLPIEGSTAHLVQQKYIGSSEGLMLSGSDETHFHHTPFKLAGRCIWPVHQKLWTMVCRSTTEPSYRWSGWLEFLFLIFSLDGSSFYYTASLTPTHAAGSRRPRLRFSYAALISSSVMPM